MDARLVSWARAVKARHRVRGPVLWLFTDAQRCPDPLPAIALLPKGLCGVVFRHDGVVNRAALAASVASLCRQRRLALSIAGDWRLAARLHAGFHARGGAGGRRGIVLTASAHTGQDIRRAQALGAVIFLSPLFPTASHPGAPALGPWRWAAVARGRPVLALGGVNGPRARRIPPAARGAGAIGALGGTSSTS